ncbi:MAG: hypothetical protein KatS3mg038_2008 [Candidatus Kapaibacterium sp.]|nr:MAG: hypothetical protein KatS3mg038_2008 [Candidatus Kapabacteria bacterium]
MRPRASVRSSDERIATTDRDVARASTRTYRHRSTTRMRLRTAQGGDGSHRRSDREMAHAMAMAVEVIAAARSLRRMCSESERPKTPGCTKIEHPPFGDHSGNRSKNSPGLAFWHSFVASTNPVKTHRMARIAFWRLDDSEAVQARRRKSWGTPGAWSFRSQPPLTFCRYLGAPAVVDARAAVAGDSMLPREDCRPRVATSTCCPGAAPWWQRQSSLPLSRPGGRQR